MSGACCAGRILCTVSLYLFFFFLYSTALDMFPGDNAKGWMKGDREEMGMGMGMSEVGMSGSGDEWKWG